MCIRDRFNGKYDGIKDLICDNIEYINTVSYTHLIAFCKVIIKINFKLN